MNVFLTLPFALLLLVAAAGAGDGYEPSKQNPFQWLAARGSGNADVMVLDAYTVSPSEVIISGLWNRKSQPMQRVGCLIETDDFRMFEVSGQVLMIGEDHDKPHEAFLVRCTFEESIFSDPSKSVSSPRLSLDVDTRVVHSVRVSPSALPPEDSLPFKLSVCVSQFYGHVEPTVLVEWIEYHQLLGVQHFYFYIYSTETRAVAEILEYYRRQGVATLYEWSNMSHWDGYLYNQLLAMQDAVYRTRRETSLLMFLDIDEFISIRDPSYFNSAAPPLMSLIDSVYSETDTSPRPTITIGNQFVSTRCSPRAFEGWLPAYLRMPLLTTRMRWRASMPWCFSNWQLTKLEQRYGTPRPKPPIEVCPDWPGRRKYIIDPRRVWRVAVHSHPESAFGEPQSPFRHIHTDGVVMYHYRGVHGHAGAICRNDTSHLRYRHDEPLLITYDDALEKPGAAVLDRVWGNTFLRCVFEDYLLDVASPYSHDLYM